MASHKLKSMAYKSTIEDFNNNLWAHHFEVSHEIGDPFTDGDNRRVICTINEAHTFHCALMPYGKKGYFININKEIRDKLDLKVGDLIKFTLEKDHSKYGIPMAEEMKELLKMDPEADKYFHLLTMGKQRSLLYIIGKPKTSRTRLHKAVAITEYLKENKGELDFRAMNDYIKNYNRL